MPTFPTLIEWELLVTQFRKQKEITVIKIGKEKVKLSLFADNMILYVEKY
jgi:hypothetical protein